jgi:hypothetical protein
MIGLANPTLKRGANYHCAYGAGRLMAIGMNCFTTGPFEGPPTIEPPALPEDTYFPVPVPCFCVPPTPCLP